MAETASERDLGSRSWLLGLLLIAYVLNFVDRTILITISPSVKEDLHISDTQLGLLTGLAFAVFYTILGIPLARVAERRSRAWIISISLATWSLFTLVSGAATSFLQLAAARVGVGIGEAGLSPSAHSLISDRFPPGRRASALAIYALGVPLGTMFGAVSGGLLTQALSWRWAFVVVGAPGVMLAVVFHLTVKDRRFTPAPAPDLMGDRATSPSALATRPDRPLSSGQEQA